MSLISLECPTATHAVSWRRSVLSSAPDARVLRISSQKRSGGPSQLRQRSQAAADVRQLQLLVSTPARSARSRCFAAGRLDVCAQERPAAELPHGLPSHHQLDLRRLHVQVRVQLDRQIVYTGSNAHFQSERYPRAELSSARQPPRSHGLGRSPGGFRGRSTSGLSPCCSLRAHRLKSLRFRLHRYLALQRATSRDCPADRSRGLTH